MNFQSPKDLKESVFGGFFEPKMITKCKSAALPI